MKRPRISDDSGGAGQYLRKQSAPRASSTVEVEPCTLLAILPPQGDNLKNQTAKRKCRRVAFAVSRMAFRYGPVEIAGLNPIRDGAGGGRGKAMRKKS